jgi:carotenoid cleavage dioxygenase-like enzyme
MSENYLAFIVPPWTLEPGAGMVGALSGAASFGHAFEWRGDERGATLIVLRKSDLGVVVGPREIHAMSTYHFAGAHEDPSDPSDAKKTLKIWVNELIGSRPNLEARFANMYDAEWAPDGYNLLAEYAVNLEDGTLESRDLLVPRASDADVEEAKKAATATSAFAFDGQLPMEFPVAAAAGGDASGGSGPPRFVYTLGFSGRGGGYFDAVQRLDVSNPRGPHHARLMPPGVFPSEVAFVPKRRKDEEKAEKREEEGYLVYLEYDASRHASDVVVLDAGDVAGAEIARVALPFHVPHTFHGEFEPSER